MSRSRSPEVQTFKAALNQVAEWHHDATMCIQGDPDKVASITYGDFNERAKAVANGLKTRGVDKGDRVAIVSRTNIDHATAFFAALKLGAIPATLHWRETADINTECVRRIGATTLIHQDGLVDYIDQMSDECTFLETIVSIGQEADERVGFADIAFRELIDESPNHEPDVRITAEDTGLINFSSGTTGYPKPIVHTHQNLVESAHLGGLRFRLSGQDTFLVYATPSFSAWPMVVLPTVNLGGTVVFMEKWDPAICLDVIESHEVTIGVLAPTVWKQLLEEDLDSRDLSSLSSVGYSAEPMSPNVFRELKERIADKVFTAYGTTETLGSSIHLYPEFATEDHLGSIGKPGPNVDVRIIEPESKDPDATVDDGAVGEIVMRGPSVSSEVWNDPGKTEDIFHRDGWFYTGDLAYRDEDGFIYLKGRSKNMIISGGMNIYPETVENVLSTHPGVGECVIVGVPDDQWGEAVKAFIVTTGSGVTAEELDEYAQNSPELSDFQRPRAYEFVEDIPKTGTGKIDRAEFDQKQGDD